MGRVGKGESARRIALVALAAAGLTACATGPRHGALGVNGTMRPYQVNGVWYRPANQPHYDAKGLATWYGPQSRYHTTADGEKFDERVASAAHTTLPLPCIVEVTNLDNGRVARLRVNDRGPFVRGRILDVSRKGAQELGFKGVAHVRVRYVGPAPLAGGAPLASADVMDTPGD
jgi:rare lipoprotein A